MPCVGSDGGVEPCAPAPRVVAVRAGRMFDSKAGTMLTKQVIVLNGERITAVGPEAQVKIPAGAEVIDLSQSTVLPGLIDGHTHMFNPRKPGGTTEDYMLIAVQNVQTDSARGLHRGARHEPRTETATATSRFANAINEGRIDGPRYQVSTLGIVWGDKPADPAHPDNPLASTVIRNAEEGRAAVRDQIAHGADWIKLYPGGRVFVQPHGRGAVSW